MSAPVRTACGLLLAALIASAAPPPEHLEFFEQEIRPLLADNCFACHSSKAPSVFANLRLDSRAGVFKGGDSGPAVHAGDPGRSLLLRAVRGEIAQMPPTGKLPAAKIAALEKWVAIGAPWPEEAAVAPAPAANGFDLEDRRNQHWAWQAVQRVEPPAVQDSSWPLEPIDRFLLARLESESLAPAEDADRRAFIRRASFDLTGLPPTTAEIDAFLDDANPDAHARLIDRLLASPHFGERTARLWMDLVRYSESHGSEGDPDTPEAWRYRDYLIRAFNADVPYDQLIREHLAGDLLEHPRIDLDEHLNESVIGTAHLRMVEHGFQPVEPWEDRVKWTDNQVDVLSKAFQGLTVSCARCHDHKFDAISQKDYYALFGVVKGARPTQRAIDDPAYLATNHDALASLKKEIKAKLAEAWLAAAAGLEAKLLGDEFSESVAELWEADSPLHPWALLRDKRGEPFADGWRSLSEYRRLEMDARRVFNQQTFEPKWDLSRAGDYDSWLGHGVGLPAKVAAPGEFFVPSDGPRAVNGVYPAGVYTNLLSSKHNGVLQSPRFTIDTDYISFRSLGGGFSNVRLIIENYAVPRGGIYQLRHRPKTDEPAWATWKTDYWRGFTAYLEYATRGDLTNQHLDAADIQLTPRPQPKQDGRSWFGAGQVAFHDADKTPRETMEPIAFVLREPAPASAAELAGLYARLLVDAVEAWRDDALAEEQAAFLDFFVRRGLLPVELDELAEVTPLVERYRELEDEIPVPRRAPAVLEEAPPPQELLIRGNHKMPGDPVPQRFLTALHGESYSDPAAARLRLADDIAAPKNPLTARVAVNRLWQRLFGRGLVGTVDNFGKLGDTPSHPELLDWLAARFVDDGWSIKKTLRLLATSRAYRMASATSDEARESDPENRLLSHMPVRRLEAEQIRDAVLAVSGSLKPDMYGPAVPVYYAHAASKSQSDRAKGPLDGDGRRSVYLEVRRNLANPFLEVFDAPKPSTTRGRRDVTNVPAQSLTMLNSPFVIEQAQLWAEHLLAEQATPAERIERMFVAALSRPPTAAERDRSLTFLSEAAAERAVGENDLEAWRDLAHSLFNLKEFLYVR